MKLTFVAALAMSWIGCATASAQITIPTVPIGNPGNDPDPLTGIGLVDYTYRVGKYEVTNAQYAAFLNAKAASDPLGLYSPNMAGQFGGIFRLGSAGFYRYGTIEGRADNPVNFVSFWDCCRFANWLHNGQGSGDTETGAYTLTPAAVAANSVTRNAGAIWVVTSEAEWYKAAFHQPFDRGGPSSQYWLFPTSSNVLLPTQANIYDSWIHIPVAVGSYSANYYGTHDMAGNIWEWNDTIISGSARGVRGGSFGTGGTDNFHFKSSYRDWYQSVTMPGDVYVGFRVAQIRCVAPVATTQPMSQVTCAGSAVSFTAGFSGTLASLQWRKNGVEIDGATSAVFTLPATSVDDAGAYDCVATNECGITSTTVATLVVTPLLTIETQPVDQGASVGSMVSFRVLARDASECGTPLAYQWQRRNPAVGDPNASNAWVDLQESSTFMNTRSALMTIVDPVPSLATGYRCRIGGGCGCRPASGFIYTDTVNFTVACPADFNADGGIDFGDVEAFFERWENGC